MLAAIDDAPGEPCRAPEPLPLPLKLRVSLLARLSEDSVSVPPLTTVPAAAVPRLAAVVIASAPLVILIAPSNVPVPTDKV